MSPRSNWFFALLITASALIVCVSLLLAPRARANDEEANAILHAMKSAFDRPEARLEVGPVAIEHDAAIAGWSQQEMGGRAFLRKRNGAWVIVLCSGDQLKSVDTLVSAGLSKTHAEALAVTLAAKERGVPPSRLALFAKFDGLVQVEGHHGHQAPKAQNH